MRQGEMCGFKNYKPNLMPEQDRIIGIVIGKKRLLLSIRTRCQDREVFLAPGTRSIPGLFIIRLWHVVHDRILLVTIRTGEMDTIPDSRPDNRRF